MPFKAEGSGNYASRCIYLEFFVTFFTSSYGEQSLVGLTLDVVD